jgi:hypothetical protein
MDCLPNLNQIDPLPVITDFRFGSFAPHAVYVLQRRMSGAPRKRQLATEERRVVKGQKRPPPVSLDHLISGRQQFRRNGEAERFRRFEIEGQFKFGWLEDGNISRFGALLM